MRALRATLAAGIAGLALALPAPAGAGEVSDVRERVQKARAMLDYSAWAAEMGSAGHAAAAFDAFEQIAARAEAVARGLDGRTERARGLRLVGATHDLAFDRFAELLDEVPPSVQGVVAEAIGRSAEARQDVVERLTGLAERLPEPARTRVLEAVAAFGADGDVEALIEALASDDVVAGVKEIVIGHLEGISAHLDSVLDQLQELGDQLPPGAREAVTIAIGAIQGQLEGLSEMIGGILDSVVGGGAPGGGVTDPLCELLGGFPIPVPIPIICD